METADAHVLWRHRSYRREEEHHTDEEDPNNGDSVDWCAPFAKREWAFYKSHPVLVYLVSQDHSYVRKVQRWRGNIEYSGRGLRRADGDAIEANTEEDHEPHSVDWSQGILVHLCKESSTR